MEGITKHSLGRLKQTKWYVQYHPQLTSLALRAKHELLDDKIAVMSLVEHVFHRPADDRNIPFADIATACDKPLEKVRNVPT